MLPEQLCLADKGYQGLAKLHLNSCLPTKNPRQGKLDQSERQHNRSLYVLLNLPKFSSCFQSKVMLNLVLN
jgi:hypothetical protein